jgi:hypothetical protein
VTPPPCAAGTSCAPPSAPAWAVLAAPLPTWTAAHGWEALSGVGALRWRALAGGDRAGCIASAADGPLRAEVEGPPREAAPACEGGSPAARGAAEEEAAASATR